MRSLALFVGGILLGLAVQTGIAQTDRVINVNHVGITVSNFDEAMKFFKESMGFREAFTVRDEKTGQPTLAYVQVSRDSFIEVQPAGADRRPGISHLGLHVENIRATLARLAQHGVKVEEPRASRTNSVIANATGPDGIRMELSELGPESLQRKAMNSWK
ncbi:MAG: hypothetical protein DMG11_11530 [Acidobacteria bacterium]|nr:MAG: hypothetical protein DMG11_11530 [Acidobacteriota bacterium]